MQCMLESLQVQAAFGATRKDTQWYKVFHMRVLRQTISRVEQSRSTRKGKHFRALFNKSFV